MTQGTLPPIPPPLVPEPRRRIGWIVVAIALVIAAVSGLAWWQSNAPVVVPDGTPRHRAVADPDARAPDGVRIRVRVVNATPTTGLARRATLVLRDFGYDVVEFDGDRRYRDSTQIVVHTGNAEWGARLRRALGAGDIVERADSVRFIDVTVLLGRDWKAPAEPLRP